LKGEVLSTVKAQLEQLSASSEVVISYNPSSSSSAGLSLSGQLEQLPSSIRNFVADKMRGAAAMALGAQAKSVFRKMNLKDLSQGFTKDCSSDLAVVLFSEEMAHAPNVVHGMSLDPEKKDQ
jgi:hypothetical protein